MSETPLLHLTPSQEGLICDTVDIPPCCPISKNPKEGSCVTLRYRPAGSALEVYSLRRLVRMFVGGFPGHGPYPPERNMEPMIGLLAKIAADHLGCPVHYRADLVLDTGRKTVSGRAVPADA